LQKIDMITAERQILEEIIDIQNMLRRFKYEMYLYDSSCPNVLPMVENEVYAVENAVWNIIQNGIKIPLKNNLEDKKLL
jgi:hypothetical protein